MSVVGSFVKRNRYSTEAHEWGEEEPSLVNLIFSKRARALTCVRVSLSACVCVCICPTAGVHPAVHSWAQLGLQYY